MSQFIRMLFRQAAGAGVFATQVLRSAYRTDLPSHNNQDPSGDFGESSSPPLRIVLLGDSSITAPGVVPLDASWPRRLAAHLAPRYRLQLRSVAVGGAKMRDVLAYQLPRALQCGGDIALVSAGANDALRATGVSRFEAELDAVLDGLATVFPKIGVAGVGDLGTMPRLPELARSMSRVRGRSIDGAIRRVVATHPGVLKARAWGGSWELFGQHPEAAFAQDHFHASAAGHGIFAASMIPLVEDLLSAPMAVTGWRGNPGSAR